MHGFTVWSIWPIARLPVELCWSTLVCREMQIDEHICPESVPIVGSGAMHLGHQLLVIDEINS